MSIVVDKQWSTLTVRVSKI